MATRFQERSLKFRRRRSSSVSGVLQIESLEKRALLTDASVQLVLGVDVVISMDGDDLVVQEGSTPELFRQRADLLTSLTMTTTVGSAVRFVDNGNPVNVPIVFVGSNQRDIFDGRFGGGPLRLIGAGGDDTFFGGPLGDTISGGSGIDIIFGGPGVGGDIITGGPGNDQLLGQGGRDYVSGGTGRDVVKGGGASGDTLIGGPGNDLIFGGPGNDIVSFSSAVSSIGVTDSAITAGSETDTLDGIELAQVRLTAAGGGIDATAFTGPTTLFGSRFADTIMGGSSADFVQAGAGGDLIDGGAGNDVLLGQSGDDTVLSNSGQDTSSGGQGENTYAFGTVFPESVARNASRIQVIDDRVYYRFAPGVGELNSVSDFQQLVFKPSGATEGLHFTSVGTHDVVVFGTAFRDTLHGGAGNDSLLGFEGRDELRGRGGNDTLLGGAGHDVLIGEDPFGAPGDDLIRGNGGHDYIEAGGGHDNVNGNAGTDRLIKEISGAVTTVAGEAVIDDGVVIPVKGIEELLITAGRSGVNVDARGYSRDVSLFGSLGADVLLSGPGDDFLAGRGGDDTLSSGAGNDQLRVSRGGLPDVDGGPGHDMFDWNGFLGPGYRTIVMTDSSLTLDGVAGPVVGVEFVRLSQSDDEGFLMDATGFSGNVSLSGGSGDDTLRSGPGTDTLRGHNGNDLLVSGSGDDLLNGGFGDDTLRGESGNDTLTGSAGADRLEHDGSDLLNSDVDDVIVDVSSMLGGP